MTPFSLHPCSSLNLKIMQICQIFLCIDEKDFYVNGGAVLCIISGVSCEEAGLAGRASNLHHNSVFNSMWKQRISPTTPPPASFSMLSQCGGEGAVEMKLFCLKWGGLNLRGGRLKLHKTNMEASKGWSWWYQMIFSTALSPFFHLFLRNFTVKLARLMIFGRTRHLTRHPHITLWRPAKTSSFMQELSEFPRSLYWKRKSRMMLVCEQNSHVDGRNSRTVPLLGSHPCP